MGLVGKPRTCRLTTEVRGAAELKRETYRAYLSCKTPQAADSYWKAKHFTAVAKHWSGRSSGCQGGGHLVSGAEVAEAVQQLCGSGALGIDEISPGYPRALDVIRQSWLTRQWNSTWTSGVVPLEWQTGVVVPICKKGERRVFMNYRVIIFPCRPGKVYSMVLMRTVWSIGEPQIKEEQCSFCPGHGRVDTFFTLFRALEGTWATAQPVHKCFLYLEKAYDCMQRGTLWEKLWEYGLNDHSDGECLVCVAGSKSDSFPVGVGLHQGSQAPPWLFANYVVLLASSCTDLQLSLEKMRISPSKTEAMVLCWKRVECSLQVWREVLSQVEEFKYFGGLFKSGGHIVRKLYREHCWK